MMHGLLTKRDSGQYYCWVSLSSYYDYFTLIEDNKSEKEERGQYPAILMLAEPAI